MIQLITQKIRPQHSGLISPHFKKVQIFSFRMFLGNSLHTVRTPIEGPTLVQDPHQKFKQKNPFYLVKGGLNSSCIRKNSIRRPPKCLARKQQTPLLLVCVQYILGIFFFGQYIKIKRRNCATYFCGAILRPLCKLAVLVCPVRRLLLQMVMLVFECFALEQIS